MEKFIEYLNKSQRSLILADHVVYVTFPLIKDKRLMFKALNEIYNSLLDSINAILQYEYFYKRIQLYRDAKTNFRTFTEQCASRYNLGEAQIRKIIEIFKLMEKPKASPFEFIRDDKIVIMSDNLHTESITLEKLKDFLLQAKDILRKAENTIKNRL